MSIESGIRLGPYEIVARIGTVRLAKLTRDEHLPQDRDEVGLWSLPQ